MALAVGGARARWTLTPEAFERLLAELDPDPARAGARYEETRRTVIFLFERRGCQNASDLADETFDRVARKLLAGEAIGNLPAFFHGVVRHVVQEYWHDHPRKPVALADAAQSAAVDPDTPASPDPRGPERMRDCLDDCLARLAPDQRTLMIEYYQGEKGAKIRNRKRLAGQMGVSMNVLGLRAFRLRAGLRACLTACLDGPPDEREP